MPTPPRTNERPPRIPTPRSVKAAAWAVGLTWAAAIIITALDALNGEWTAAILALLASLNAAGWYFATRRWIEWSAIAVGLLSILEHHGIRLDEPPSD